MKLADLAPLGDSIGNLLRQTNLPHYPSAMLGGGASLAHDSMESLRIQTEKDKQKTLTIGELDPIVRKIAQQFEVLKRAVRVESARRILDDDGLSDDLDD